MFVWCVEIKKRVIELVRLIVSLVCFVFGFMGKCFFLWVFFNLLCNVFKLFMMFEYFLSICLKIGLLCWLGERLSFLVVNL